jgi:hypothetical protein
MPAASNRWIQNLKPEWAKKWEQRERMGEAESEVIKMDGQVTGGCTAPTFSETDQSGTAPATGEEK